MNLVDQRPDKFSLFLIFILRLESVYQPIAWIPSYSYPKLGVIQSYGITRSPNRT